jgi:hypothetical protein
MSAIPGPKKANKAPAAFARTNRKAPQGPFFDFSGVLGAGKKKPPRTVTLGGFLLPVRLYPDLAMAGGYQPPRN